MRELSRPSLLRYGAVRSTAWSYYIELLRFWAVINGTWCHILCSQASNVILNVTLMCPRLSNISAACCMALAECFTLVNSRQIRGNFRWPSAALFHHILATTTNWNLGLNRSKTILSGFLFNSIIQALLRYHKTGMHASIKSAMCFCNV